MTTHFLESCFIGMAIAAIVGPISLLFIRKTLEIGLSASCPIGLGTALGDGFYAVVAALGFSVISNFVEEQAVFIKISGGMFLLYLAYKDFKSELSDKVAKVKSKSFLRLATEIFFLTLANPLTIASFVGVFAAINNGPTTFESSLIMALGVFLGSLLWWVILGSVLLRIKHKIPKIWIERIKYTSVFIIAIFGIIAIVSALKLLF